MINQSRRCRSAVSSVFQRSRSERRVMPAETISHWEAHVGNQGGTRTQRRANVGNPGKKNRTNEHKDAHCDVLEDQTIGIRGFEESYEPIYRVIERWLMIRRPMGRDSRRIEVLRSKLRHMNVPREMLSSDTPSVSAASTKTTPERFQFYFRLTSLVAKLPSRLSSKIHACFS